MKKENLIKGFVVILLLALSVGSYFYFKDEKQTKTRVSKMENIPGWKTYQDQEYGFTFQAPKEWEIKKGKGSKRNLIMLNNEDGVEQLSISIRQNKKNQKQFEGPCFKEEFGIVDETNQCVLNFNAGKGFVYSSLMNPKELRFIILANERLTFSINNSREEGQESMTKVDKVINSIYVDPKWRDVDDFIMVQDLVDGEYEIENIETDDWKEYQNQGAGFKVRIPADWICEELFLEKKEEKNTEHSGQNIYCSEQEDKNFYDEKGNIEKDEKVGRSSGSIGINFSTIPSYQHISSIMLSSISSADKNIYSSTIAIRNLTPNEDELMKSFENSQMTGLVFLDKKNRFMRADYDNRTVLIKYFNLNGEEGNQNVFDGVLKSFRCIK